MSAADTSVIILHGDDDYAIAREVDKIFDSMGDPGLADLNTTRLDGRSASEEDIRTATGAIPFLAERRLVVLAHALARMGVSGAQARFEKLLDGLPPTTTLTLLIEDTLEKRGWKSLKENHWLRKWVVGAGKRAEIRDFPLPPPARMPEWIIKRARELGGVFSLQAAQALAAQVGSDTRQASLEIDKLLNYVDFARQVEADDVELLAANQAQAGLFEMVDLLAARNKPAALRLLHRLLEDEDQSRLFGLIIRQFRMLVQAREIMDERGTSAQIQSELNMPYASFAEKLYRQAQPFTIRELEGIYHRLLDIDEGLKTSRTTIELALDTFIAEL